MCLYPRFTYNPKYKRNNKNGWEAPKLKDGRLLYVPIECKECIECRKNKAREWHARLMEDIKVNKNGIFVTLTFSNESLKKLSKDVKGRTDWETQNMIATRAVRLFLERWRKHTSKSPRHWLITELGHKNTERIHLHGIIWTNEKWRIKEHWQYGWIWDGNKKNEKIENYVNGRTASYITKYITKQDLDHVGYRPVILNSAGIGRAYTDGYNSKTNAYKPGETDEAYRTESGHKIKLPIYWRNKIYSEEERELLWIEKLDKKQRWVCGEKIDISKNTIEYYKTVEYYRKLQAGLGYRKTQAWNKTQYDRIMAEINYKNDISIVQETIHTNKKNKGIDEYEQYGDIYKDLPF